MAKTISAYDKEVSDDLYGSGSRYVSKQRLEAMLDNEWAQLLTQLEKTRVYELQTKESFLESVAQVVVKERIESTISMFAGPHSRPGTVAPS